MRTYQRNLWPRQQRSSQFGACGCSHGPFSHIYLGRVRWLLRHGFRNAWLSISFDISGELDFQDLLNTSVEVAIFFFSCCSVARLIGVTLFMAFLFGRAQDLNLASIFRHAVQFRSTMGVASGVSSRQGGGARGSCQNLHLFTVALDAVSVRIWVSMFPAWKSSAFNILGGTMLVAVRDGGGLGSSRRGCNDVGGRCWRRSCSIREGGLDTIQEADSALLLASVSSATMVVQEEEESLLQAILNVATGEDNVGSGRGRDEAEQQKGRRVEEEVVIDHLDDDAGGGEMQRCRGAEGAGSQRGVNVVDMLQPEASGWLLLVVLVERRRDRRG